MVRILLVADEDETAIRRTGESGRAGNHVERIVVLQFPQMMDEDDGYTELVREQFE